MGESRAFVENVISEKDDSIRARLEGLIGNWDQDRLLGVLIEVQDATDNVIILSRATRLQNLIIDGNGGTTRSGKKRKLESLPKDIDELKAEMEMMNHELDNEIDEEPQSDPSHGETRPDSSSKGWTMWEGPWVPKPIGVV